jgi:hypothetical protein
VFIAVADGNAAELGRKYLEIRLQHERVKVWIVSGETHEVSGVSLAIGRRIAIRVLILPVGQIRHREEDQE